jgi:adenylate cyclase class IV
VWCASGCATCYRPDDLFPKEVALALEIEFRARFDEATYEAVRMRLQSQGDDLGVDDKHIYFYVLPDKLLKVTENLSARTAKVVVKTTKIGEGSAFPEIELPIAAGDVPTAVRLLDVLGYEHQRHDAFNRRHNYRYGDVEVALKWSEAWGHHAEFEIVLTDDADEAERQQAETRIHAVADELGVHLMTDAELREFTRQFEEARAASPT